MCCFSKADEPIEVPDRRRLITRRDAAGITALQVGAMSLPLAQA
jgi:hypothetical protein